MTNKQLDDWDDFCGSSFLKAEHVKDDNDAFAVTSIEIYEDDDGNTKPRLNVENKTGEFLFDLNVTNSNFCRNNGISSPNELVGKKIYFRKINVISPKLKKEVESLRICRIE